MRIPLVFGSLVALVAVSFSATDSVSVSRLAGVVTDSEGAAISNAVVVVHWDRHGADAVRGSLPGLTEDLRLTTDKAGGFSAELAPGFYDIAVFARAFSPQAFKLRLRTAKAKPSTIKLVVDPLECEEFCENLGTSAPTTNSHEPKQR